MERPVYLSGFAAVRPRHVVAQGESLAWLASAHAKSSVRAEPVEAPKGPSTSSGRTEIERYAALFARYGCGPDRVASRGHELPLEETPTVESFAERTDLFASAAERFFAEAYPAGAEPPEHLIHVTCTGYVSPSAAQLLVARRNWPTTVTHAYHMGCAGAFPAVRIASAFAAGGGRVDVVHTELCSLHLDAAEHSPEQLVAQGLFADGCIRYSASRRRPEGPALELVASKETLVPGTEDAMTWRPGPTAMRMTLAKRMPALVRANIRPFVEGLFEAAGLPAASIREGAVFAVHPGGPKIIDAARDALGLKESQLEWSRRVLFEHGNMSSATIPHVWKAVVDDPGVPAGAWIPSVAFGPGLTVSGALFRKA